MVSSIGSITSSAASQYAQMVNGTAEQPKHRPVQSNDTVQLSTAAQRAIAGDVDHDGDTH
jgi:hypothetical protein